jgi:lipopolysaccharide export system protein LptA
MKLRALSIFLLAAGAFAQSATNTNRTEISSDNGFFDKNARRLVYSSHVEVTDPRVRLWCERLTIDLPPEGRPTNVVAETNVIIDLLDEKNQTNHVTADKAVYSFSVAAGVTNELVTFTGSAGKPPAVATADAMIFSEPLIWDRGANKFHFQNERVILNQSISGTNSILPK